MFHFIHVVGCVGKKLSESIVKEKLAACVNRVPGNNFLFPIWFVIITLLCYYFGVLNFQITCVFLFRPGSFLMNMITKRKGVILISKMGYSVLASIMINWLSIWTWLGKCLANRIRNMWGKFWCFFGWIWLLKLKLFFLGLTVCVAGISGPKTYIPTTLHSCKLSWLKLKFFF